MNAREVIDKKLRPILSWYKLKRKNYNDYYNKQKANQYTFNEMKPFWIMFSISGLLVLAGFVFNSIELLIVAFCVFIMTFMISPEDWNYFRGKRKE